MPTVDLTARLARDSRPGARDTILFDRTLPGFGLRIHPSGRKVWIVQARIAGRTRRLRIARHDEMEIAEVRRCAPHMKPSGRKTVRIYLKARILPAFGKMPLDRIAPEDVAAWFDAASRDRPGAANRAFEILRSMMFRAEEWGRRAPGTNPCLGISKNPRTNVARFLDIGELERLGRALDAREAQWPETVAAIRLLALTGCRRSEVLDRRWRDIADDAIKLPDSKTGPRAVPRGRARAYRHTLRRARPGRVPVPALRRGPRAIQPRRLLARALRRCKARQAAAARPAAHRGQPGRDGRREPAPGRQAARTPAPPHDSRLCAPGRRPPRRSGGEDRNNHRECDGGC